MSAAARCIAALGEKRVCTLSVGSQFGRGMRLSLRPRCRYATPNASWLANPHRDRPQHAAQQVAEHGNLADRDIGSDRHLGAMRKFPGTS